jgi:hypothetical protein
VLVLATYGDLTNRVRRSVSVVVVRHSRHTSAACLPGSSSGALKRIAVVGSDLPERGHRDAADNISVRFVIWIDGAERPGGFGNSNTRPRTSFGACAFHAFNPWLRREWPRFEP